MQYFKRIIPTAIVLFIAQFLISANKNNTNYSASKFLMPYKNAGLSQRQAAAHLLDRFTFGTTTANIDEVCKMGLENWFSQQLDGNLNDDDINNRLKDYDAINLTNTQVVEQFPRPAKILKEAIKEGLINKDSAKNLDDKNINKEKLKAFMQQKGYKPEQELLRQFVNQKFLRATYSNNQLHEVLTDFWFNHFNVSATKNDCAQFIPAYERDVIRPNVTGKFGNLLLATAQSPAMLLYLDNFTSTGINEETKIKNEKFRQRVEQQMQQNATADSNTQKILQKLKQNKNNQGLNENYAREIMELHTLGVDGGYTQQDVTQAAKVLTGWTIFPMGDEGPAQFVHKIIEKVGEENLIAKGYVHQGDFMFAINRHDNQQKIVLGHVFNAGGGYNEGVELINILAHHPSTAKFICKKLATRFVSDNPPSSLINKMAEVFLKSDGDIKQVLIALVSAPEFWDKQALREKIKSPFELTVSAIRSLQANAQAPFLLYQWITKMGQKYYYYQAPTGFPDNGQYWINTGSLLYRMNFGLAVAAQKIPGLSFNLEALNNNHEPESAEAALKIYCKILLPERDVEATIKRLTPLVNDPNLIKKIDVAAEKTPYTSNTKTADDEMMNNNNNNFNEDKMAKQWLKKGNNAKANNTPLPSTAGNNTMLAQVVGIILGSPEFQRK